MDFQFGSLGVPQPKKHLGVCLLDKIQILQRVKPLNLTLWAMVCEAFAFSDFLGLVLPLLRDDCNNVV